MSEIKICLRPVIGNKDLAVLIWIHSTRINIEIWVELLHRYTYAPAFEETSKRSRCNTLS